MILRPKKRVIARQRIGPLSIGAFLAERSARRSKRTPPPAESGILAGLIARRIERRKDREP